jgi:hypothetical protein
LRRYLYFCIVCGGGIIIRESCPAKGKAASVPQAIGLAKTAPSVRVERAFPFARQDFLVERANSVLGTLAGEFLKDICKSGHVFAQVLAPRPGIPDLDTDPGSDDHHFGIRFDGEEVTEPFGNDEPATFS